PPSPLPCCNSYEYGRWAGQYLVGYGATDVVSSSSDVRARFDTAGTGENAIAAAVRAALGLHAKASLAAVPLTLSLVGSTLSGDAAAPATRRFTYASAGELVLDHVTRAAAERWLAEHPSARTQFGV